jgi:manganese transport protein
VRNRDHRLRSAKLGARSGQQLFKSRCWGVAITALDVLLLLALSRLGMRRMEAFIIVLVATIGGCFAIEMLLSRPDVPAILKSLLPRGEDGRPSLLARDPAGGWSVLGLRKDSLYIAMGILGATVCHTTSTSTARWFRSRAVADSRARSRRRMNLIDSAVALSAALFINAAILVLAAVVFRRHQGVARLEGAPAAGAAAGTSSRRCSRWRCLSGQASTITARWPVRS